MAEQYSNQELEKVQKLELNALKVVDQICKELGIEYFAIGGTALGAIRHGGYIPWDDDIDIGMLRADYEKFVKEACGLIPEGYTLQTPYVGTTCPYPYSKLKVDGTEYVEYSTRNLKVHQGVYVDIFPFDEFSDDDEPGQRIYNKIRFLVRLFTFRQKPDVTYQPAGIIQHMKAVMRRVVHYGTKMIPYHVLLNAIDRNMKKFNNGHQKGIGSYLIPKYKAEYIEKERFYPLKQVKFEDMVVGVASDYHTYLTRHYGDYMVLPPESERVGHKPYRINLGNCD